MSIFFTSDTHFHHKNICRGVSTWDDSNPGVRDFDTLDDMNQTILDNINKVVGSNDTLYHLGDFAFQGVDNYRHFREKINCNHIHFICGNHDNKHGNTFDPVMGNGKRVSSLFESYSYYKQIYLHNTSFVLFHYPISSWDHMSSGGIHLHGHCHSPKETKFFNGGKSFDVGIDGNDFCPYEIGEVFEIVDSLPVKSEGHH